jgi:hypothetical protein
MLLGKLFLETKKACFLFLLFILLCSCNRKQKYENEDLLFRYIDEFHKAEIEDVEYNLITVRTRNICATCYEVSIDTLIKNIVDSNSVLPLYILFDEEKMHKKNSVIYNGKIIALKSGETDLDRYGIEKAYPNRFHVFKGKIVSWEKIYR